MIILDRGADGTDLGETLEFLLSGAVGTELPFVTSYVEFNDVQESVSPENEHGTSSGAAAVEILGPPSDVGLTRQLKAFSTINPNAANVTVTVRFNDNTVTRNILTTILEQYDTLQYNDGEGFRVIDASGNLKFIETSAPVATNVINQTNPSATTLTDAYTVPVGSNFEFKYVVANRSVTATSFRVSIAIAGAADDNKQYVAYDTAITGNDIYDSPVFFINATDVIRVYATLATLTFTITGELHA